MSRLWIVLLVLIAFTVPGTAFSNLNVVATVPTLAALATEVGGDRVTVTSLTRATQDPHFADARPNLALMLNRADVLLQVGLDLEIGWLGLLQSNARNARILNGSRGHVDCSLFIQPLEISPADRSMGHIHPNGNPHYLYDPRRLRQIATGIANRFIELDPEGSATYSANLNTITNQFDAFIARWSQRMAAHRGTQVITFHRSFSYLVDWLGWQVPLNVEPKPGLPPTPGHVATVISTMTSQAIPLIIQENYYPSNTSELIASRTEAELVIIPSGPSSTAAGTLFPYLEAFMQDLEEAIN